MIQKVRPSNHTDLLLQAVASARQSRFWSQKLGDQPIRSQADFDRLPFTSVDEYRTQNFDSVIADPDGIEWIPGPWLGQSADRVPVAEGPDEAQVRVKLMADAIGPSLPEDAVGSSALVITAGNRRHFGAEMCAVLVRMGVQAHLVTDEATDRIESLIRAFEPDVVAALSWAIDLKALPDTVTGIVTAGRGTSSDGKRHIDLFIQNELGVLGASVGSGSYILNHHRFNFEESPEGTLSVTPYYSRVQPLVRLDTGMPASVLN